MNKNRVGILTFHSSHNCGSMLQAYALQTVLTERYDAEVDIINFSNSNSRNMYALIDKRPKKSSLRNNIKTIKNLKLIRTYRKDYIDFKSKYLHTTKRTFSSFDSLCGIEKNYDILIAGGDQVWNVKCPDADKAYFLGFAKNVTKAAYSPSLGGININGAGIDKEEYRKYLLDFDYISVREPNGCKWLKELTGLEEIPIIADPTLLLTHEEWLERFELPDTDEKFIFNYAFYHNRPEANEALRKISEETGMPVYVLDAKSWAYYRLDMYGIRKFKMTGPLAFLALMDKAEMVFTQSFHGTLFSALFHKQFWSYRAPVVTRKDDDRATAILSQLGLSGRYKVIDDIPSIDYMEKIDYSHTDELIEKLRKDAFDYLDLFMK